MVKPAASNAPRVSVLIATYNYGAVLRYAIATVLWQTFRDFEVIVVGDCCTDNSEEVVRSFGDPRIRWLNLAENSGSKSLPQNAGIKVARGAYIAYLAHDDLWHPLHLETLVRAIENNEADLVHSVAIYVPPSGETQRQLSGVFPEGHFRAGYALVHSSVLHRRALTDEIGDWPDYRTTQMPGDHVFWTRLAEAGKRVVGVPKPTVWKFNASSRPNSYVTKRSDEQARYFRLLRDDTALAEKELIACAESAMRHGLEPLRTQQVGKNAPCGSYVQHLRQIRGLEPAPAMNPLPAECGPELFCFEWTDAPLPAVIPAARFQLELRIVNDSDFCLTSNAPNPIHFSYHWQRRDASIALFEGERTLLLPPLEARSSGYYYVDLRAPIEEGTYELQPALVQENVRWFDGIVSNRPITISVAISSESCPPG